MIKPKKIKSKNNTTQKLYKFENGYGASVVRNIFSCGGRSGLWELAVIKWIDDEDFSLDYKTPITNDVIGYLYPEAIEEILLQIKSLTPEGKFKQSRAISKSPVAFMDEQGRIVVVGKSAFKNVSFVDADRAFPDSWKELKVIETKGEWL